MSDQTRQAIHDAIQAHVIDELGVEESFVTHWVIAAGMLSDDPDSTPYLVDAPAGQAQYISAGLLHEALHPSQEEE